MFIQGCTPIFNSCRDTPSACGGENHWIFADVIRYVDTNGQRKFGSGPGIKRLIMANDFSVYE